jgi:hypothetical protein
MSYELQKIRQLFREFYELLPVIELVENEDFIQKIETIERQLRGILDADPAS